MAFRSCRTNPYVEQMYGELASWALGDNASENRGLWRSGVFKCSPETPVDLEIGTGNGFHFAQYAQTHVHRKIIGLELKFKPLVQTVRRCLRQGSENMRLVRWDASDLKDLFVLGELNNIYIHHPDPWPKKRHLKNRLIQPQFLIDLYELMAPGGSVEFKTDHYGYFQWATYCFGRSPFVLEFWTENLHGSIHSKQTFVTGFEQIFIQKNQPIFYCTLRKI